MIGGRREVEERGSPMGAGVGGCGWEIWNVLQQCANDGIPHCGSNLQSTEYDTRITDSPGFFLRVGLTLFRVNSSSPPYCTLILLHPHRSI